jgi:hypothetical protein
LPQQVCRGVSSIDFFNHTHQPIGHKANWILYSFIGACS